MGKVIAVQSFLCDPFFRVTTDTKSTRRTQRCAPYAHKKRFHSAWNP